MKTTSRTAALFLGFLLTLPSALPIAAAQEAPPSDEAKSALDRLRDLGARIGEASPAGSLRVATRIDLPLPGATTEERALAAWDLLGAAFGGGGASSPQLESTEDGGRRIVVYLRQTLAGLPVVDARAAIGFDREGALRTIASSWVPVSAVPIAAEPQIDAARALDEALKAFPEAIPDDRGIPARLVWLASDGVPVLAWEVWPTFPDRVDAHVAWIDATTAELLQVRSRTLHVNRANVYMFNPGPDGDAPTEEVDIPAPTDPDGFLANEFIVSTNCVDNGETLSAMGFEVPICSEISTVQPTDGDYFFEPDAMNPEDSFAEVHMYFHANQQYDYFRGLGLDELRENPLHVIANFRITGQFVGSRERLAPYDNAAFMASGPLFPGYEREYDSLLFGQGTDVDFAYDGDVIYHEFGHAVVTSTSDLQSYTLDEQGMSAAPGALNEGYADYFAAARTDDPAIGDYVGATFAGMGSMGDSIRNIDNTYTCPTVLWGETHQDSLHWTGALWEIRTAFLADGGNGHEFDTAVYDAMISLSQMPTFDDASELTLDTFADVDAQLDDEAEPVFDARGTIGCERVIDMTARLNYAIILLMGTGAVDLDPFAPGFMAFKVTAPADTIGVAFNYMYEGSGGGGGFGGALQHGWIWSDEPIRFQVDGRGNLDGSWIEEIEPRKLSGNNWTVELSGEDFSGRTLYFMPVGYSGQQGQMGNIRAAFTRGELPGEDTGPAADTGAPDTETDTAAPGDLGPDVPVSADAGDSGGAGPESDDTTSGSGGSGCGCASTASRGDLVAALGLLGLALVGRRRLVR